MFTSLYIDYIHRMQPQSVVDIAFFGSTQNAPIAFNVSKKTISRKYASRSLAASANVNMYIILKVAQLAQ